MAGCTQGLVIYSVITKKIITRFRPLWWDGVHAWLVVQLEVCITPSDREMAKWGKVGDDELMVGMRLSEAATREANVCWTPTLRACIWSGV